MRVDRFAEYSSASVFFFKPTSKTADARPQTRNLLILPAYNDVRFRKTAIELSLDVGPNVDGLRTKGEIVVVIVSERVESLHPVQLRLEKSVAKE